jgi:hypothetical protein
LKERAFGDLFSPLVDASRARIGKIIDLIGDGSIVTSA